MITAEEFDHISKDFCRLLRSYSDPDQSQLWLPTLVIFGPNAHELFTSLSPREVVTARPWAKHPDKAIVLPGANECVSVLVHLLWTLTAQSPPVFRNWPGDIKPWINANQKQLLAKSAKIGKQLDYVAVCELAAQADVERAGIVAELRTIEEAPARKLLAPAGRSDGMRTGKGKGGRKRTPDKDLLDFRRRFIEGVENGRWTTQRDFANEIGESQTTVSDRLRRAKELQEFGNRSEN